MSGHIYLLRLREHILAKKDIYKIGRTGKNVARFKGYPNGAKLIIMTPVINMNLVETQLIRLFKDNFIHRNDIGREYFEGDVNLMVELIKSNCQHCEKTMTFREALESCDDNCAKLEPANPCELDTIIDEIGARAIRENNMKLVKFLLDKNYPINNAFENLTCDNVDLVRMLNCNGDVWYKVDAVNIAREKGYTKIVDYMCKVAGAELVHDYKSAIVLGDIDILRYIRQFLPKPDEKLWTVAILAEQIGSAEFLKECNCPGHELYYDLCVKKFGKKPVEEAPKPIKIVNKTINNNYTYNISNDDAEQYLIHDFIEYIKSEKPEWYKPGEFIPKRFITNIFNEKYEQNLSTKTLISLIKKSNDTIIAGEKSCHRNMSKYGMPSTTYRCFLAGEV